MKRQNFTTLISMTIIVMMSVSLFAQNSISSTFKRNDLKKQKNLNWASAPSIYPVAANIATQVPIDPTIVPQFVDPLPHFAAGLRVNAKAGGNLIVKAVPHQQIALSTGTVLSTGTIGSANPSVGLGNYWTYTISKDNGTTWTPPLWPAFTIEAQRGNPLTVKYQNGLFGQTYASVNLTVEQMIHWAMPVMTPDPYSGPVPIVTHLHGGEVPSMSDGGPYAWFTPGYAIKGAAWGIDGTDSIYHYGNTQEPATLWIHDHAMGATRLNVYAGLAAYYFLRGTDEEADKLPGWSGDDLVKEVAPAGKTGTFNSVPYLPEIEIAIQDRMFDTQGGLYWPINPTNPEFPEWTPEFFGNIMMVNGKSWPFLSVAPRKYRFRVLDGCNARFLNLWLKDTVNNVLGPKIQIVGTDGGLLDSPVTLDASIMKASPLPSGFSPTGLFMAPGERFDIIIDFTGMQGKSFTLLNDAVFPYPSGDVPNPGLDGRIMQFVVNGQLVSATNHANVGEDKSEVPTDLRNNDIVKLTNFSGGVNVTPAKKRQLTLNESEGSGGPLEILVNNSHYDNNGMVSLPGSFGDVTEHPTEGTSELVQIINTTMDAHPMHFHLVEFQLVSRQAYDAMAYEMAYGAAFAGGAYKPAAGPPSNYNVLNSDGALGGNPSISSFLTGSPRPPLPEEKGWKDTYKAYPGEVTTFIIRYAPTDAAIDASDSQLMFGFDPSKGPGYVWHCHIIDHEDNEMMRPYYVEPSPLRSQQVCLNSTENTYQAPTGMTNYLWNIPAGGTLLSGGGVNDNSAKIKWTTAGQKLVTVNYTSGTTKLSVPSVFGVNVNNIPGTPTVTNVSGVLTSNATNGNQWFYSATQAGLGAAINAATNKTYIPLQNGWYWTMVTLTGCNSNVSNKVNFVNTGLAITEAGYDLNVYPSLSDGHFTASISIPGQETFSIVVFNALGQRIYEQNKINVNVELKQEIDLGNVPGGIYSVLFSTNTKQVLKKIFISK